jgi:hypothetical protein
MKRIIKLVVVSVLMVVLTAITAAPAFADPKDPKDQGGGWCNPSSPYNKGYYKDYCWAQRDF